MTEIILKPEDKVFFLDDDIQRIWAFKAMLDRVGFDQKNLFIAEGVRSALYMLGNYGPFDLYFLDHDLLDHHYGDLEKSARNPKGTGQEVVSMLGDVTDSRFVLHTWNPHGAEAMKKLLSHKRAKSIKIEKFGSFELVWDYKKKTCVYPDRYGHGIAQEIEHD